MSHRYPNVERGIEWYPKGRIDDLVQGATRQTNGADQILSAYQFISALEPLEQHPPGSDLLSRLFLRRLALFVVEALGVDGFALVLDPRINPHRGAFLLQGRQDGYGFSYSRQSASEFLALLSGSSDSGFWDANLSAGASSRRASFGRLGVSRKAPFTPEERLHLTLLAGALGTSLQRLTTVQFQAALQVLDDAIKMTLASRATYRDMLSRSVRESARATRSDLTAYFSCDGTSWTLEFSCYGRDVHHHDETMALVLRPDLAERVNDGRPFHWTDGHAVAGLPTLRPRESRSTVAPVEDFRFVLMPIRDSGVTIGCFVLAFNQSRFVIDMVLESQMSTQLNIVRSAARRQYHRRYSKLLIDPIFTGRDSRVVPGRCCVLMPFTEVWSDRIWNRIVKPAVSDANFQPIRADDLYGSDVMEDIWAMILSSEVVIADITNRNANVFYELGVAHAIGKRVILQTQSTADIPFDLNRYRHVIYEDNADGYDKLTKGLTLSLGEVLESRRHDFTTVNVRSEREPE